MDLESLAIFERFVLLQIFTWILIKIWWNLVNFESRMCVVDPLCSSAFMSFHSIHIQKFTKKLILLQSNAWKMWKSFTTNYKQCMVYWLLNHYGGTLMNSLPMVTHCQHACKHISVATYLKPSYFSGTLILVNLARGHVIAKFNMR